MEELYENIRQKRIELGMTQEELAKSLGYADKSMIAKIEAGKVDLAQSKILAFASALNTTPSALMGWKEDDDRAILLQKLYDEKRILFDAADDATTEEIRKAAEYLEFLESQRG